MKKSALALWERKWRLLYRESNFQDEAASRKRRMIARFMDYIVMYDKVMGTDHKHIVESLYFENELFEKCSLEGISMRLYIDRKTLYQYRLRYVKLMELITED